MRFNRDITYCAGANQTAQLCQTCKRNPILYNIEDEGAGIALSMQRAPIVGNSCFSHWPIEESKNEVGNAQPNGK